MEWAGLADLGVGNSTGSTPVNTSFPFTVDIPCCLKASDGGIAAQIRIRDTASSGLDNQLRLFVEIDAFSFLLRRVELPQPGDESELLYVGFAALPLAGSSLDGLNATLIVETRNPGEVLFFQDFLFSPILEFVAEDCTSTSSPGPATSTTTTTSLPFECTGFPSVVSPPPADGSVVEVGNSTGSTPVNTSFPFTVDIPCCLKASDSAGGGGIFAQIRIRDTASSGPDNQLRLFLEINAFSFQLRRVELPQPGDESELLYVGVAEALPLAGSSLEALNPTLIVETRNPGEVLFFRFSPVLEFVVGGKKSMVELVVGGGDLQTFLAWDCTSTSSPGPATSTTTTTTLPFVCPSSELVELSEERQVGPKQVFELVLAPPSKAQREETAISFRIDIPCCANGTLIVRVLIDGPGPEDDTLQLIVESEDATVSVELLDPVAIPLDNNGMPGLYEYRQRIDVTGNDSPGDFGFISLKKGSDEDLVGYSLDNKTFNLIISTLQRGTFRGAKVQFGVKDCGVSSTPSPTTTTTTTTTPFVCPPSELVELSGERQVGPNATLKARERVETNISFRTDIPCCGNGSMIVKVVLRGDVIRGDEFSDETLELMVVSEDEAVAVEFLDLRATRIDDPGGGLFEYVGRIGDGLISLAKSGSLAPDEDLVGYSLANKTFNLIISTFQPGTFLRGSVEFDLKDCGVSSTPSPTTTTTTLPSEPRLQELVTERDPKFTRCADGDISAGDALVGKSLASEDFALIIFATIPGTFLQGFVEFGVEDCPSSTPSPTTTTTTPSVCSSRKRVELPGETQVGPQSGSVFELISAAGSRLSPPGVVETRIDFQTNIPCCADGDISAGVVIDGERDDSLELYVESQDQTVDIELFPLTISAATDSSTINYTGTSEVAKGLPNRPNANFNRTSFLAFPISNEFSLLSLSMFFRFADALVGKSLASEDFALIILATIPGTFLQGFVEFGVEDCPSSTPSPTTTTTTTTSLPSDSGLLNHPKGDVRRFVRPFDHPFSIFFPFMLLFFIFFFFFFIFFFFFLFVFFFFFFFFLFVFFFFFFFFFFFVLFLTKNIVTKIDRT
eukprot:s1591_g4.t5